MKKAVIVTSAIDINNNHPLTYSHVRTHFDSSERFRQTVCTIASLDSRIDDDTTIFLLDASDKWEDYAGVLGYQKNLIYVPIKRDMPEIFDIIRSHKNKSFCETLQLATFFSRYTKELDQFDYFFKMSGRYFTDRSFNLDLCNEDNLGKLFFKRPMSFDWNENWPFTMVDRRAIQGDNKLYQYCTVLYGFGRDYKARMTDIYKGIAEFTGNPSTIYYDVETLIYFFTRPYEQDVIQVPWTVYGWDGAAGNFLRY